MLQEKSDGLFSEDSSRINAQKAIEVNRMRRATVSSVDLSERLSLTRRKGSS